jgi:hypothetical protein
MREHLAYGESQPFDRIPRREHIVLTVVIRKDRPSTEWAHKSPGCAP